MYGAYTQGTTYGIAQNSVQKLTLDSADGTTCHHTFVPKQGSEIDLAGSPEQEQKLRSFVAYHFNLGAPSP